MSDGDDRVYTEEEIRTFSAGSIQLASGRIDTAVWGMTGERVRVWAQGKDFIGTAVAYDGKRIVMKHDTGVTTVIWLESGVILSEVKK